MFLFAIVTNLGIFSSAMNKLILASGSTNRKTILSLLHIPFEVIPAEIDEKSIVETNPLTRAKLLAKLKGESISRKYKAVIISADTFTTIGKRVLEKPQTIDEAKNMLHFLSGKQTKNNTGLYYYDPFKKIIFSQTMTTKVKFRKFFDEEIEQYLQKFPVKTWAAAYAASEFYVMGMIEKVDGSLTGLTHGLPLEHLVPLLIKSGFKPHP